MTEALPTPLTVPPRADEIEVSLFGPGTGESCVIHLGHGEWMVVDSCRLRRNSPPASVAYLDSLGASVAEDVKAIVATHWHDDHISGMAELFERASSAEFYFSSAIRIDELEAFVKDRTTASRFKSGANELARVKVISKGSGARVLSPVAAGMRIWFSESHPVTEVWAMSPSSADILLSWEHIGGELARRNNSSTFGQLSALSPNDASVVLLLLTTNGNVLLGADLEHHPNSRTRGWHAVRDSTSGPIRVPAKVFKVPHHGSSNADCPEVWEHEIADDAVCIIAPFGKGVSPPPQPEDLDRIRQYRPRSFLTSNKRGMPIRRDRTTQKSIKESTRAFVPNTLQGGHLQLRFAGNGPTEVRGSHEACAL